ncbi:MAG: hypothetical protein KF730_09695 [Sphingomonas sp.]|uniref:hypothetical protein n=1 Tax=Sphingomonas sp. TaxID=28214 RepID=UPI0025D04847|nr:hypothetical protein [Sphingomonas sp.]MBX3564836.1 hypothetical protein [Sphingomonas sp.]
MKKDSSRAIGPGRYASTLQALNMIGRGIFQESWNEEDHKWLETDRRDANDVEAWDRAASAAERLKYLVVNGLLRTFGEDDEGTSHELGPDRTTTPWFKIDVQSGSYLVYPDQRAPLTIDRFDLEERLAKLTGKRPRKTQTFDWLPIAHEAWRYALHEQLLPRTRSDLIAHLQQWYFLHRDADNAPDEKELGKVASGVIDALGNRRLAREDCVGISSTD